MLSNYFDKIFIISINEEKKKICQHQFDILGEYNYIFMKGIEPSKEYPFLNVEQCIYLSHLECLKISNNNNYKKVIICEDDFAIQKTFVDNIEKIKNNIYFCNLNDIDILFFHNEGKLVKDDFWVSTKGVHGFHFYGVFSIQKVLNCFDNSFNLEGFIPVDKVTMKTKHNLKCLIPKENYVLQYTGYSSTIKKIRDESKVCINSYRNTNILQF